MGRINLYNKETDTTYVYESQSYYDPEKKQSRSKRKLIGKIDKETGEIVPTGRRGPGKKAGQTESTDSGAGNREAVLEERLEAQEKEIGLLRSRISVLEDENRKLRELNADAGQMKSENQHMSDILQKIRELLGQA